MVIRRKNHITLAIFVLLSAFFAALAIYKMPQETPASPTTTRALLSSDASPAFFDASGQSVTLADWKGEWVLLHLWATWCGPCLEEMPKLDQLAQAETIRKSGLRILPVAMDMDRGERKALSLVRGFYEEQSLSALPLYLDPTLSLMRNMEASSLPTSFLITPDGKIARHWGHPVEWDNPAILKEVSETVKNKTTINR